MPLINSIVSWLNFKRRYQIELFKKFPFDVQRETLFKLLDRAKDTEWGIRYDFASIKTIKDFQERLPLVTYERYKPVIDRLLKGGKDIVWPGEIKWFAKSSGTTSDKSKFIPVTKESLEDCHFRGGKDVIAIYTANHPDNEILTGKGLTLGGSHQINKINNESYYGDLSAILIDNLPFWVHLIKTPRQDIALLSEWEEKLDKIADATIKENVTNISGVPSWTLVLLKYIMDKTGAKNILEVWPNLELFIHGGVSFDPYRKQFEQIIPSKTMNYLETYNASEGFFAIQNDPETRDMLLILDLGIFYEFIPFENLEDENPKVLHIDEVEKGKNYAMVITTNSGLWRYMIGDTVTFTSLYPHKIRISGRTKHFINAFGEEVIIDNAERALEIACELTGAIIKEYTAAPVYMDHDAKGAHEWLIEFEQEPDNPELFKTVVDKELQNINSDYEAKRYKNITLTEPLIHFAQPGLFYKWMKNRGKLGGQNKVPRLSNDRKYIDELLNLNAQN